MGARAAIFDLDGTLADTSGDLLAAANHWLEAQGLAPLTRERDAHVAGRGGRAILRRGLQRAGAPVDEARIEAAYPVFLERYAEALHVETRLYDGVEECLEQLAADGWALGICTNKPEYLAERLIRSLGLRDRFAALLGADTLAVRKPDPAHVLKTVARIGGAPARAVMIGDTATDRDAARNAGVPCVLVTFGFADRPVTELAPEAVIDSFAALPDLLPNLIGESA